MNNHEVGEVISVPAASDVMLAKQFIFREEENSQDGTEHDTINETSAENGSVLEVLERNVWNWRKELLPSTEGCQEDDTNNNHGNDIISLPSVGSAVDQAERQKQQRPTEDGEAHANNYPQLMRVIEKQRSITYHRTEQSST